MGENKPVVHRAVLFEADQDHVWDQALEVWPSEPPSPSQKV